MNSGGVDNHNRRIQKHIFGNIFFGKTVFCFDSRTLSKNPCKTFPEMLWAIFSELTSFCPKEQIEKTSGFWKVQIFLIISGLWAITQYNFGKSGFGKPVKNDFYSSRETFWRKQIFENFYESDLFLILGIKRLAGWSICLYVSSGTVMESCTFCGKWKFFCRFHTLCETFLQLQAKLAGLSI